MAVLIDITKSYEDDRSARYLFEKTGVGNGVLEIDKNTGDVILVESACFASDDPSFLASAWKVKKLWKAGHLPERAVYAA